MSGETCSPASESLANLRELDYRVSDGINVWLRWDKSSDEVRVDVWDKKTGAEFSVPVHEGDSPLEVFNHPYAYAHAGNVAVTGFQEAA